MMTRGLAGVTLPSGRQGIASSCAMALSAVARGQFAVALHGVFVAGAIVSGLGLIATFFLPHVDFTQGVAPASGERMLAAEMTNLEPDDEPIGVMK
jgi:hypothetical protein